MISLLAHDRHEDRKCMLQNAGSVAIAIQIM